MKKGIFCLMTVFGLISASTAFAGDTGFYGAVDAGQTKVKDLCNINSPDLVAVGVTSFSCDDKDTAYRIALGYMINNNFSVEGSYVDAGQVGGAVAGTYLATAYTGTLKAELTEFQLAAIGYIPVAEKFSLFGKAGITRWDLKATGAFSTAAATARATVSDTGTDFLWGIGAKYDISKTVALRGQFESRKVGDNATTGEDNVEMLSLGLVFKFQ